MEQLTKKESETIKLMTQGGLDRVSAVEKAFNCKSRNVARSYASVLFKKEKVAKALIEAEEGMKGTLIKENEAFVDLVKKYISMDELARLLVEGVRSKDLRIRDAHMEKILRVVSAFPKEQMQNLDGSNFQLVFVRGKEDVKTITGKDLPAMIEQETIETIEPIPTIEEDLPILTNPD